MAGFLGMRGTGNWATNQVPESWRQMILHEFPNGSAPLTAMLSMMGTESIDSHTHHWWTKTLPSQGGAVTQIYIDAGLSTAYVYATHQATHGISGATVYVNVAEAVVKEFRAGHQVLLRDTDQLDVDIQGKVTDVAYNGASSYFALQLKEADDNHTTSSSYNIATVDRCLIIGNINPEGSDVPAAIGYDPVESDNRTQIWRNSLDMTNTAIAVKLRTGEAYQEAKRETLELHSIEMEKSAIWGINTTGTGANGKPERTAGGIVAYIRANASANIDDFRNNTTYSGQTWLQGGKTWFNTFLATLFRYAKDEVLCFCGDSALLGIQELAETFGDIKLSVGQKDFGIAVITWITPFGVVHFKTHPLFSYEATNQRSMLLFKPKNVRFKPLKGRDTFFEKDVQIPGVDGKTDCYTTEGTWEHNFPNQFMMLNGVGAANTV